MSDNIKHPVHYCKGGIECIEAIKAVVSTIADPFEAYCTGNIVKYIWRWNDKNGIEDLRKAIQYIEFIEQHRTAEKSSCVAEDNDMGEEDVSENDEGKWAIMNNVDLSSALCNLTNENCDVCPVSSANNGKNIVCADLEYNFPAEFRAIAIKFLREKES